MMNAIGRARNFSRRPFISGCLNSGSSAHFPYARDRDTRETPSVSALAPRHAFYIYSLYRAQWKLPYSTPLVGPSSHLVTARQSIPQNAGVVKPREGKGCRLFSHDCIRTLPTETALALQWYQMLSSGKANRTRCKKIWAFVSCSSLQLGRSKRAQCRRFSTPPIINSSNNEVEVRVKVGLGAQIPLTIRHSPRPETNGPVIIYLKRGIPTPAYSTCINELAWSATATVVRIDYEISNENPYPFPIHTVLAGYDWVRKNLIRSQSTHIDQDSDVELSKIGVCGELVGGSLAAMLALTESYNDRQGIRAAAIGNAIVDWTALFPSEKDRMSPDMLTHTNSSEVTTDKRPSPDVDPLSIEGLLAFRKAYFSKAENFFDPFASPLLFFRTPSFDLPYQPFLYPADDPSNEHPSENKTSPPIIRKRRSHRKYPPLASELRIPRIRVDVGKESVLRDQGLELVELMRKSARRSELEMGGFNEEARQVEAIEREALGLWDEREMIEIGQWFGEALRNS